MTDGRPDRDPVALDGLVDDELAKLAERQPRRHRECVVSIVDRDDGRAELAQPKRSADTDRAHTLDGHALAGDRIPQVAVGRARDTSAGHVGEVPVEVAEAVGNCMIGKPQLDQPELRDAGGGVDPVERFGGGAHVLTDDDMAAQHLGNTLSETGECPRSLGRGRVEA